MYKMYFVSFSYFQINVKRIETYALTSDIQPSQIFQLRQECATGNHTVTAIENYETI